MKSKIIVRSDFFLGFLWSSELSLGEKKKDGKSGVITETVCRLTYWKPMDLIQSQPVPEVTKNKYCVSEDQGK